MHQGFPKGQDLWKTVSKMSRLPIFPEQTWGEKSFNFTGDANLSEHSYHAHTNRFYVLQENIKPEVLKVQTELARSVH